MSKIARLIEDDDPELAEAERLEREMALRNMPAEERPEGFRPPTVVNQRAIYATPEAPPPLKAELPVAPNVLGLVELTLDPKQMDEIARRAADIAIASLTKRLAGG